MTQALTQDERDHLYTKLVEQKSALGVSIETLNNELKEARMYCPDPIDQASGIEAKNSILAQINNKRELLKQINISLDNFDDFGICTTCGSDIETARIKHNLSVKRCIGCQEVFERKSR